MKTLMDFLSRFKTYQHDMNGKSFEISWQFNSVVLTVGKTSWGFHESSGALVIQDEIQNILENEFGIEIRFCEECGSPMVNGFTADDGQWYCCEDCFVPAMDNEYGRGNWHVTTNEGEYGGFYEALSNGKWEDTGIYYTEWY